METSASTPSLLGQYLHGARFQHSDCLDDQQIRLLELKFGHSDEIVCINVQTYSINDYPPYIALSYTWGDPNDTVDILCNGETLAVTSNLKEALWQFRENRKRLVRLESSATSPSQLLHFWIDAICIDQECNKEKSFQVGMMGNIYEQARHVFTWLGPADESSDVATRCIDTIGKMAEDCGLDQSTVICCQIWYKMIFAPGEIEQLLSTNATIFETIDGSPTRAFCEAAKDMFDTVSGWNGENNMLPITELANLFTRPWWTRIWVLQEVTLSRDTHFVCGTQRLPRARYTSFMIIYNALRTILINVSHKYPTSLKSYHFDILEQHFHRRPTILLGMPALYRQRRCKLADLVQRTSTADSIGKAPENETFQSTKPEDKIFAVLGLAADRDELKRYGVVPNYDIPYQQTYAITMAALLQQGHISFLSIFQTSRSPGLPSWVPDWSRPITYTLREPQGDLVTVNPEFSCSGHRTSGKPTIKVLNDHGVIRRISIKSCLYDEVYQVGHFNHRSDQGGSSFSQLILWSIYWLLEILRLSYRRRKDYKGFHNRLRASARTCIGEIAWDKDGFKERVGDSRYFDAVLLLRQGLQHIEKGRFKLDAHGFLNNQKVEKALRDKNDGGLQLPRDISRRSRCRLPFVTRKGHIGLSSQHVMPGDVIAIIEGGQVPFVFRREDKEQFSLVSEAYVDGIMDGEIADTATYSYVTLV